MPLLITPIYAAILGIVFVVLSARVIQMRGAKNISLGDGGNDVMERRVRAQGNFAEYTPLALLLIAFAEVMGAAGWLVHLMALLLLAGRLAHGWSFSFTTGNMPARVAGMLATLAAVVLPAIVILVLATGWLT